MKDWKINITNINWEKVKRITIISTTAAVILTSSMIGATISDKIDDYQ